MSYLITVELKKTKESESADGKGPVYLKIKEEEILEDSRKKATSILENRVRSGQPFTLDDVVADYDKAHAGDGSMREVVERSKTNFTYDPEVASMGRIFDADTDSVFTRELKDMSVSLLRYILVKSDECKEKGQVSVSRSYLSLLRSLDRYLGTLRMVLNHAADGYTAYADRLFAGVNTTAHIKNPAEESFGVVSVAGCNLI